MFGLDLLIINVIKSLAIFTGTFKGGLMVLTGIITYAVATVKCQRRGNK